jgi:hypothetical protein
MRLSLALLAAATLVAGLGIADRTWKGRRVNHAELREWYCVHQGTRCGGPAPSAIERHWNHRELVYEIVVTGLLAAAATVAVHRLDRGWRRA